MYHMKHKENILNELKLRQNVLLEVFTITPFMDANLGR